jgi:hypothetical protein
MSCLPLIKKNLLHEIVNGKYNHTTQLLPSIEAIPLIRPLVHCWKDSLLERDLLYFIMLIIKPKGGLQRYLFNWKYKKNINNLKTKSSCYFHNFFLSHLIGPLFFFKKNNYINLLYFEGTERSIDNTPNHL